ncbi:methionine ABC transporter ATP-binding protein [Clostridiales bacterium PH28_bin88]|nr:methionine ABC transporter ATP-binding protein [Clostridiales bacterium PH28_bin88]
MLTINNLEMVFETTRGRLKAINNVDFAVAPGEIVGLVGESGCGKSATLLSIMRLVPYPGKITRGEVLFQGENLLSKSQREMRQIRGKEIAMVFQDPMTTLNPVYKVGEQIRESLRIHGLVHGDGRPWRLDRPRRRTEQQRVMELMREVGIPSPEERYWEYPHQFSGGMQQRAIIAIALACEPKLLLADEPTTALDVTIQAQILQLLKRINEEHGTSIVIVTHDLGVAAEFCHKIAVMYAGRIMEQGSTSQVLETPLHPYTEGLLKSIPRIGKHKVKIEPIPGNVADLANLGAGCAFAPRCPQSKEVCTDREIPFKEIENGHQVRCQLC